MTTAVSFDKPAAVPALYYQSRRTLTKAAMFGCPVEREALTPITLPVPKPIKTAPREEERRLLLWCPEQGSWHTGEWCDGRWLDSLMLTE